MLGRLLSVETTDANDPDFLVALKIMTADSKDAIFLGKYDTQIASKLAFCMLRLGISLTTFV